MKKFENTEVIEKESTYTVKDIEITFMEKNRVDKETGKIIYDTTLEQENDIVLYNIYLLFTYYFIWDLIYLCWAVSLLTIHLITDSLTNIFIYYYF